MAAALLTLFVGSTPAPDALAAPPALADPVSTDGKPRDIATPAADSGPLLSLAAAPLASPTPDTLPDVPADAGVLDTAAPAAVQPAPAEPAPAEPAAARHTAARPAAPSAVVRAAAHPARMWAQLRGGLTVSGVATWYSGTRGYAGIAHVAMPGARYLARGRSAPRARVCAGGRCITVRVVDACACHVGSRHHRVADLSATARRRLGLDPRRGVYNIRVSLLAP